MQQEIGLKYNIVWCTKYRRKVITQLIKNYLEQLIKEVCIKNKFKIESLTITENVVNILVITSTRESPHRIVSQIKGITSFKLREMFPELKKRLPCLWTKNYYAITIGQFSEEGVTEFIESQKNI